MQTEETSSQAEALAETTQAPIVYIADLKDHDGQTVTVRGWLMHHRDKKKLQFLVLRDGTGTVQAVAFVNDVPPASWEKIAGLTQESSVVVTGTVRKDERAPGGYEL